ncbi:MAG: hypothetical protein Q8S73_20115 [Deltaproteobacteria bacterium]|nr:hypothetical protein [Deltaproteobacteria bacterium]
MLCRALRRALPGRRTVSPWRSLDPAGRVRREAQRCGHAEAEAEPEQ